MNFSFWKIIKRSSFLSFLFVLLFIIFFNFFEPTPVVGIISIPIYFWFILTFPSVIIKILVERLSDFLIVFAIPMTFFVLAPVFYSGRALIPESLLSKLGYGSGWLFFYVVTGLVAISLLTSLITGVFIGYKKNGKETVISIFISVVLIILLRIVFMILR